MDVVLETFLSAKAADASTLSERFVKQQEKVIESFGGITNIVEMCLTNQNAHKYIDVNSKQFISFKAMLQIKNADYSPPIEICHSNNDDVNVQNINVNTNTNDSNNSDQQQSHDHRMSQTVTTAAEFYRSTLLINCYPKHNMLFTLMKNNYMATLMYNMILSKRLFVFMICLGVIFCLAFLLRFYTPSFETILLFNIVRILMCTVTILTGTCLILVANKTVTDLITNTFDYCFVRCGYGGTV